MILAAGRGERMRPLTDRCPKPLLAVGGQPLIVWHIQRLAAAGLSEIVINHAHLGQMIETALEDGAHYGVTIDYSAEITALETAGGIAYALPLLGKEPFLVVNGDIYCDFDFSTAPMIAAQLNASDKLAWLLLVNNPAHHPQGDFYLQGKEIDPKNGARLTFSGIGIYHPRLFNQIIPGQTAKLAPLLYDAIDQHQVIGQHYTGQWADIGTPQRLHELDAQLRNQSYTSNT